MENKLLNKCLEMNIANSKSLAAHIVSYKVYNIDSKFSLICMEELVRRRNLGEEFNFEQYIEDQIKLLPKPDPIVNFKTIIKNIGLM